MWPHATDSEAGVSKRITWHGAVGGASVSAWAWSAVAPAVAATGTLTLAPGRYDGEIFRLDQASAVNGVVALDAGSGGTVLLGATTQVLGGAGAPVGGVVAVLGGGTLANQGTISLVPASALESTIVYQPTGKFHSLVGTELIWTQSVAPTLDVSAAVFGNSGLVALAGGTLDFSGGMVRNTGSIRLADATGQTPQQAADGMVSVVATTFATRIEVAASVGSFSNSGTMSADVIAFDGSVALSRLGTLNGALDFAGSLDLGGGTLAATAASPVTIGGTVQHGALLAGDGLLALQGATLAGVALAGGTAEASGTLRVLGLGGLSIHAGAVMNLGAGAVLTGGSGAALVNNGTIAAASGADVTLQAGLAGAGTMELGANAAVTVDSLALFAKPTFLFDPGASLLSLPGSGAGVTLADLHEGDVLDFSGVSSVPAKPGARGSAYEVGNSLHVIGASGHSALVALSAPSHGLTFAVGTDGHGGTLVTVG
jgi:hypothetical protein